MRCFRQALAFLFSFIGSCGFAWSQPSLTPLRSTITDPSALTSCATVTTVSHATSITSTPAASDQVGERTRLVGVYG